MTWCGSIRQHITTGRKLYIILYFILY